MVSGHVGMIGRHINVVDCVKRQTLGELFAVVGERQGQITEGKLVNMPVYLIVSSHSVTCNYIIMTEGKHRSFNLLLSMPAVSCVVHLWSWKPINNKTKCDKPGLVLFICFLPIRTELRVISTFIIGFWKKGAGGGG